jgi:hypothetical protein
MFTTKECLAVYVGHFTYNWGNYLFLTQLPTYMKEVLHFDIKSVINQLNLYFEININYDFYLRMVFYLLCRT